MKATVVVGLKGRDDFVLLPNDKYGTGQWFQIVNALAGGSAMSRSDPDLPFKAGANLLLSQRVWAREGEREKKTERNQNPTAKLHRWRIDGNPQ